MILIMIESKKYVLLGPGIASSKKDLALRSELVNWDIPVRHKALLGGSHQRPQSFHFLGID